MRQVLDRIRAGGSAQPIGEVRFCILALSGAGGRVMVRDFIEGTVLSLADTTERWFDDLSLDSYFGRPGRFPSLEQILTAPLAPKKSDQDYVKWVAAAGAWRQALWRAALTGGRMPETAFSHALLSHNNMVVKGGLTDEKEGPRSRGLSRSSPCSGQGLSHSQRSSHETRTRSRTPQSRLPLWTAPGCI